jgi:hypothetical protein
MLIGIARASAPALLLDMILDSPSFRFVSISGRALFAGAGDPAQLKISVRAP